MNINALNVSYVKRELREYLEEYNLISDCIKGEIAVKKKTTKYLPMPDEGLEENDENEEALNRYYSYIKRAVFYNVTSRTVAGLLGEIFAIDPKIIMPEEFQFMKDDVNGEGVNIIQFAKKAAKYTLAYGRLGLFVDYPETKGSITINEKIKNNIRPAIKLYEPWDCINWRTKIIGIKKILSLIVLQEEYISEDDGFEEKIKKQYRVLRLNENNVFIAELWRTNENNEKVLIQSYAPTNSKGDAFNEIPFKFVGSENNDIYIDEPPMYDIASLNIAHYRNSADFEESSFVTGQPTVAMSGLTEDWYRNVLKGSIHFGSRGGIPLPKGAKAELIQADPNIMPEKGMARKEEQMFAIGAKLIGESLVEKTATEIIETRTSETSILSSISKNVSDGILWGLKIAAVYEGVSDKIDFHLNDDFRVSKMSPEDRRQLLEEWIRGGISKPEYRNALRKKGIATQSDEDAEKLIQEELMTRNNEQSSARI